MIPARILLGIAAVVGLILARRDPAHRPLARAILVLFVLDVARAVAHPWQDANRTAWALDVAGFVAAYVVATGAVWRALKAEGPGFACAAPGPSGSCSTACLGPRSALTKGAIILRILALLSTFALAYAFRPHLRGAPIAWLCGSPDTGQPGALPVLAAVVQLAALVRWGAGRSERYARFREVPTVTVERVGLILAGSAVADGVIRLVPLEWWRQMRVNAVAWGCIAGVQAWALWRARKARNVVE